MVVRLAFLSRWLLMIVSAAEEAGTVSSESFSPGIVRVVVLNFLLKRQRQEMPSSRRSVRMSRTTAAAP